MAAIFPNLEATSAGSSEVFGCGQECGNESQGRIRGHTTPLQNSEVHPAMVSQYPPTMHGNQSDNASGAALLQQFPQSGGRHDKSVYDQEYSDALCEQDWEHMKKGQKVVVTEWENVENKELGEDDFLDIRKAICDVVTGDWKEFGIALGFTPSVINGVSEANPSNPRGSLFDLLHKWVCKDFNYQQFGPPSWRTLVRAVAGGGRNFALAEKIAKMHPEADYRLISNAVLGECDFQDIRAAVGRDLDGVWKGFGATLGIAPSAIKGVAVAYPGDPGQCLFDILDRWLRKDYNHHRFGPPSWGTLVTAVASNVGGQNPALAEKIAAQIHNDSPAHGEFFREEPGTMQDIKAELKVKNKGSKPSKSNSLRSQGKLNHYPSPSPDLFANGWVFTELDLSKAYQKMLSDEESRRYVTINTYLGLYQYTRLQDKVLYELHKEYPGMCQALRIHHLFLLCMHGFGPAQLWQRIHINSAGPFMEKTFILTLEVLRQLFGLPEQVVPDNGPQFTTDEFAKFMRMQEFCMWNRVLAKNFLDGASGYQIETGALWRRNADQMDWRKIQQDIVNGNKKLYKCPINSTQNY
eukprot:Em0004g1377a